MKTLAKIALLLFAIGSAAMVLESSSCKPPVINPCDTCNQVKTPSEHVYEFLERHSTACGKELYNLETVVEPTGTHDTNYVREKWTASRWHYELFGEFAMYYRSDYRIAFEAPFGSASLRGFHYLEQGFFIPNPHVVGFEPTVEYLVTAVGSVPATLQNGGFNDLGVFRGLQLLVSDIDTVKLKNSDSAFSNSSYTNIMTNLAAIDSVYSYYDDSVKVKSPSADSALSAAIADARSVLTTAGNLPKLDKAAYRINQLGALTVAIRRVALALNITL